MLCMNTVKRRLLVRSIRVREEVFRYDLVGLEEGGDLVPISRY